MQLNPFAISGLLITVTYLPLFLFIFLKGKTKLAKIYSLHIFAVLWWGIFSLIIANTVNKESAELFWKLSNIGVFFIPVFFSHAVLLLTRIKARFFTIYSYTQAIFFLIITLLGMGYTDVYPLRGSFFYGKASHLYNLGFINWLIICTVGHVSLINYYKTNFSKDKKQIYLLYSSLIGFFGGAGNFLPTMGFDIYPYGNFLVPIHSFVVTYAILRYQFLNIEFVFRRGIVYSLLLILVLLFYAVAILVSEHFLQQYFGYKSLGFSVMTAFIIGIAIIPLRNKIQHYVDRIFFKRSLEDIAKENERLRQEIIQTDKLKSISTFASGMAHEIKNPLTSIKTFCEYLPQKIHDKKFLDTFIPLVSKDADRINELIHDLLEYSKPSPPQLVESDIHKIVESVVDVLCAKIIARKIQVARDYDQTHIPEIPLDSRQIKQALLNIMLNSIEAMPEKGILTLKTRLSHNQKRLNILISDSGCGIAPDNLLRVFDPFFTTKEKGTGLGLSITHGIIKEHGGKIFVESTPGQGTTFRIELPIKI